MTQTIQHGFPQARQKVERLVQQHVRIRDEPLLFAMYYSPARDPQDVFLFEVIQGFGADAIDANQDLFEVTYHASSAFPLEDGQQLHLVLTNEAELKVAFRDRWPLADEVRAAVRSSHFEVLHQDPKASGFLELIRG